jgi:hypothetical protein
MRRALLALVTVGLLATTAVANQCPLLIKQLNDAVAARAPDDARARTARGLIEQARKLHAEGRHAESIAKADEAAKVLGITLTKQ